MFGIFSLAGIFISANIATKKVLILVRYVVHISFQWNWMTGNLLCLVKYPSYHPYMSWICIALIFAFSMLQEGSWPRWNYPRVQHACIICTYMRDWLCVVIHEASLPSIYMCIVADAKHRAMIMKYHGTAIRAVTGMSGCAQSWLRFNNWHMVWLKHNVIPSHDRVQWGEVDKQVLWMTLDSIGTKGLDHSRGRRVYRGTPRYQLRIC
jgi:hypothetical protein